MPVPSPARRALALVDKLGPLLAMVGVWILFSLLNWPQGDQERNTFANWENTQTILLQTAVVGIAALGGTMIIISGGIDLSIGSLIAVVSVMVALVLKTIAARAAAATAAAAAAAANAGVEPPPAVEFDPSSAVLWAVLTALGVAGLCGLATGTMVIGRHWFVFSAAALGLDVLLVWHYGRGLFATWPRTIAFALLAVVAALSFWADRKLKPRMMLTPFIVTLGMWGALRGAAKGLANNSAVYPPATGLTDFMKLPEAKVDAALLRNPGQWWSPGVWIFLALAVSIAALLRYTQFGRHIYAIGSNEQTARLCGVNVERTKLKMYTLAALLGGVAGVLQFGALRLGDPTTAAGYELKVIAAVVIGGASLSGGVGTVLGTVSGALMMTIIDNGCTKVHLEVWMQEIITGVIIVAAVALDQLRHRRGR
jgi:ribose/xylose/arabinose/galactoside ABC-type transport system permease subunit